MSTREYPQQGHLLNLFNKYIDNPHHSEWSSEEFIAGVRDIIKNFQSNSEDPNIYRRELVSQVMNFAFVYPLIPEAPEVAFQIWKDISSPNGLIPRDKLQLPQLTEMVICEAIALTDEEFIPLLPYTAVRMSEYFWESANDESERVDGISNIGYVHLDSCVGFGNVAISLLEEKLTLANALEMFSYYYEDELKSFDIQLGFLLSKMFIPYLQGKGILVDQSQLALTNPTLLANRVNLRVIELSRQAIKALPDNKWKTMAIQGHIDRYDAMLNLMVKPHGDLAVDDPNGNHEQWRRSILLAYNFYFQTAALVSVLPDLDNQIVESQLEKFIYLAGQIGRMDNDAVEAWYTLDFVNFVQAAIDRYGATFTPRELLLMDPSNINDPEIKKTLSKFHRLRRDADGEANQLLDSGLPEDASPLEAWHTVLNNFNVLFPRYIQYRREFDSMHTDELLPKKLTSGAVSFLDWMRALYLAGKDFYQLGGDDYFKKLTA